MARVSEGQKCGWRFSEPGTQPSQTLLSLPPSINQLLSHLPLLDFLHQNRYACHSDGLTSPSFSSKEKSALFPGLVTETPAEFLIGFLSHPPWKGGDYCDHPSLARGLLFDQSLRTGKRDYVNV